MEKPTRILKVHLIIKGKSDREIKNEIKSQWNLYKFISKNQLYKGTFESFVFNFDKYKIFKK